MITNHKSVQIRRWTNATLHCYGRGCVCEGCLYSNFFEDKRTKCQAKISVLESVRVLGKPDGIDEPTFLEDEVKNV